MKVIDGQIVVVVMADSLDETEAAEKIEALQQQDFVVIDVENVGAGMWFWLIKKEYEHRSRIRIPLSHKRIILLDAEYTHTRIRTTTDGPVTNYIEWLIACIGLFESEGGRTLIVPKLKGAEIQIIEVKDDENTIA